MSECKLVPVEPTPEMRRKAGLTRGADYYTITKVWRAMLAAAPAVQGEPVAYLRKDQLHQVRRMGPMLGEIADSPRVDRVPVYAAPQPAPCRECGGDGAGGEHEDDCAMVQPAEQPECGCCGQTDRCDDDCDAVVIGGHRAAEQKPAPDVSALVEALTELCDEIDKHEIHAAISKTSISWFKRKARAALAAYRKGVNDVE